MTVPFTSSAADAASGGAQRPAIVLVAFGTSVAEARQVFDHIHAKACQRYPQYDIHWAFTSKIIRRKLQQRGITTRSVVEVVADLRNQGCTAIAMQSLHVVPGQEYHGIQQVDTTGLQVALGAALLTSNADVVAVADVLASQISRTQPTVVVAHGHKKYPQYNQQVLALARLLEGRHENLVVASVEGQLGSEPLEQLREQVTAQGTVHFVPLMVVAGDHIRNDVMGDEVDSWKNLLQAPQATCAPSLGWQDNIVDIYFEHLDQALAQLQQGQKTHAHGA